MTVLANGDFELDGYLFTGSPNSPLYVTDMSPGSVDARVQDRYNPVGHERIFGRDYRTAPTWEFQFRVGAGTVAETRRLLGAAQAAWLSTPTEPGGQSVLRYAVGDTVRRIYGRPRRFTPEPAAIYSINQAVARATFDTADALHYDDAADSLTLSLIPANGGGLVSPLVSPLTTAPSAARQGLVTVGGDAPAPMEVTFKGPVLNPQAASSGWFVGLEGSLAYDQSVTINTRDNTVLRNDGASLGGQLSRRTYLAQARLHPGAQEFIFTGTDPTGTASCTVSWRNTYYGF